MNNEEPPADVYSLGAILYCLLTARPPFQASNSMDTLLQVLEKEPLAPRELNAAISPDLETICLKCLQKDPRRRYGSAQALADDLSRFLAGEPIPARRVSRLEKLAKWARRRPAIAGLSAALIVIGLVGLSGIVWQWRAAVSARIDAQDQAKIAGEQAEIARVNESAARRESEFANRRLYDVKMNVVDHSWQEWSSILFFETLEEQRPENQNGVDRRGFEWYYWQRKTKSGQIQFDWNTKTVHNLAFSPDGKLIAIACLDGTAKLLDTATGREMLTFKGHTGIVDCVRFSPDSRRNGVAFSPDGTRIASSGADKTLKIWDARPFEDAPDSSSVEDPLEGR